MTLYLQIKGTGVFLEWVTKVVEMLESAARAAGYAIKKFFEGVGCEIASWFGSKCKDRKVEVEVHAAGERDAPEGLHDPDRDLQPADVADQPEAAAGQPGHARRARRCASTSALRADQRGIYKDSTGEIYEIAHVGGIAGSESIRVTAFGRSETFDGIAEHRGRLRHRHRQPQRARGRLRQPRRGGGSENDSLSYNGYGTVTLDGDGGNDTLYVSNAVGTVTLRGGAGDDLLVNDSGATGMLEGGADDDDLLGGSGDDGSTAAPATTSSRAAAARTPCSAATAATACARRWSTSSSARRSTAAHGNDGAPPSTRWRSSAAAAPDSIRVSTANGQLIISELLGNTVVGSFTGINVERLRLTGDAGADTFTLVGALELGGLKTLSIDMGAGADTVVTQLTTRQRRRRARLDRQRDDGRLDRPLRADDRRLDDQRPPARSRRSAATTSSTARASPPRCCGTASTSSAATATTRSSARRPTTTSTPASATTASPAWAARTRSWTPAAPTRSSRAGKDFGLYGNLLVIGTLSGSQFVGATAEDISVFERATLTGSLRRERPPAWTA